jgi:hypothetical protein
MADHEACQLAVLSDQLMWCAVEKEEKRSPTACLALINHQVPNRYAD